jgi:hypothetical protein
LGASEVVFETLVEFGLENPNSNSEIIRGDIYRIENPSVWQIPMFKQIFPMRNMGRLCVKWLKKIV